VVINKLLPRHTQAGIKVVNDDHCVRLTQNGATLSYTQKDGTKLVAVWTGPVTLGEMVAAADEYLNNGGNLCQ